MGPLKAGFHPPSTRAFLPEGPPGAHEDVDEDVVPLGVAAVQQPPVLAAHVEGDLLLRELHDGERDERAGAEHAAQDRHAVTQQTVLEHLVLDALEAAQSQVRDERGVPLDPQHARVGEEAVHGLRDHGIGVGHTDHPGVLRSLDLDDVFRARPVVRSDWLYALDRSYAGRT